MSAAKTSVYVADTPPPHATCLGTTRHLPICITCISSSCGRSTTYNSSTKIV